MVFDPHGLGPTYLPLHPTCRSTQAMGIQWKNCVRREREKGKGNSLHGFSDAKFLARCHSTTVIFFLYLSAPCISSKLAFNSLTTWATRKRKCTSQQAEVPLQPPSLDDSTGTHHTRPNSSLLIFSKSLPPRVSATFGDLANHLLATEIAATGYQKYRNKNLEWRTV